MKSNIVKLSPNTPTPPHKLGEAGLALWNSIQSAYAVDDAAGAEILAHACLAADRLVALGEVSRATARLWLARQALSRIQR
jgi:hypothetical protein